MDRLRVTLDIILQPDVIQDEELNEAQVIEWVEEHLFQAIGHPSHTGYQLIKEMSTVSVGVS